MCSAVARFLIAFIGQAHAKQLAAKTVASSQEPAAKPDSTDKLVDKLFVRAVHVWAVQYRDLEDTTLEKGPSLPSLSSSAQATSPSLALRVAPAALWSQVSTRRAPDAKIKSMFSRQFPHVAHRAMRARSSTLESNAEASLAVMPLEGRAGSNSPPVLSDNLCLTPGEPVVRIEDAPDNSVRIFTGIDVVAPMQNVWDMLTDYENLNKVVPSLVQNDVLQRYEDGGARIAQTGSADVLPGISFKAKMVLDVKPYYEDSPLPESQIADHLEEASSDDVREFDSQLPLVRGVFPRPYSETSLPHRDITMVNVNESPGDFEHYQGLWRVQPLPGCSPTGGEACRLTYAVEIKPKGFLPVKLIDRRIASDLKVNLMAIRQEVEAMAVTPQEGRAGSNSPPVLSDNVNLTLGEPVVRIEKAPDNAVRIFTGVDMVAPMQSVWDLLTDYENLDKAVPSLVQNDVLQRYEDGARIAQTGAADVLPGLSFKAKMVLDIKTYLEDNPIPESQIADHLEDKASSADVRDFDSKLPLVRGVFPRPYSETMLPHRDITMANVVDSPGDFDHYQGVWRIQNLPRVAPQGGDGCRLTYAVEIKPKGFLPVGLIERRIASDLKMNLMAIREQVEAMPVTPQEGRAGSNSPPVLLDNLCLVPGEPVVRIENAPSNGVRIFTGVDVEAPMQSVWDVLTDYENLDKAVPSLVQNDVLQRYADGGARIAQTGAADVLPGVSFKAKMVLDIKTYLEENPIPESQIADHLEDTASSADVRDFDSKLPLVRGVFPRPYSETRLPHRDITMQNVVELPGDFDHYQGVWRVQSLPGCAPQGGEGCRLSYAVEIKPKGFLPVKLIERRIASDLKINLKAIRSIVEAKEAKTALAA